MITLDVNKIRGSGFTIIVQDDNPMSERSQADVDELMDELERLSSEKGFSIAMIGENEEMMRLQGKLLFNEFWKVLDKSVQSG